MLLDIGFDDVVVWPRRGGRLGSVLDVCRVETLAAGNARWKRRYWQAWAALAVFGEGNVIEDVGPSTYMSRNCIDGLVVKLRLSSFGGLLGAAAAAGVVSEVVLSWLGSGKRGNWWKISHRTRCGRVGNSVVRLVTGL